MINLRYHIVSIVAVFLALGIGLALGSTLIDSVLISNLEGQVDELAASEQQAVDDLATVEDELAAARDANEALLDKVEPLTGVGRLSGQTVMLIAPESVARDQIDAVRALILESDARFEGTLIVRPGFDLTDEQARQRIAGAFDLAGDGEGAVDRGLSFLLTQAMFRPDDPSIVSPGQNALSVLRDLDMLAFESTFAASGRLETLPSPGTRFVVLSDDAAAAQLQTILEPLLGQVIDEGFSGTITMLDPEGEAPLLEFVRGDERFSAAFSTVDNSSTFDGELAMMLAMGRLPLTGHHGVLDSAESLLPVP